MEKRIVEFGRQVWSLMTDEEHEHFGIEGTFYFIELIASCVWPDIDWTDTDLVERIHDEIFN